MSGSLQDRIKQSKPFSSLEAQTYLNLILLAQELSGGVNRILKTANLSMPQYNALRILRGAGDVGRTCREVGERMVHRVPDVTRLLDRLEERGLIVRGRETTDRRVVRVRITRQGLEAIKPLDAPLDRLHARQLGKLGPKKLQQLNALIEAARAGLEE